MFYKDNPDQIIRQGDIIKGLISPEVIAYNFLDQNNIGDSEPSFSIDLRFNYVTVITPCCTIQKADYISCCPLNPITKRIEKNPYFADDPTLLNRKLEPEKCVPPDVWENKLSDEVKQMKIEKGPTYIYFQNFVFEKYGNVLHQNMMIDFNNIFNVRRKDLGNNNQKMIPSKVLQVTDETRQDLRQKLVAYYMRIPEEEEKVACIK